MNIGTNVKQKYSEAPATEPHSAMLALLAEVTRWNTSCCGIEPNIMVIPVPRKVSHSQGSAGGKNENLPAALA